MTCPRILKFRGWDEDRKKMWSPQDISAHRSCWPWLGLYDLPLMQFTGLTDKDGVEIYEGDIVHVCNSSVTEPVERHEGGMWMLNNSALISGIHFPCEIIGNIYENPELLDGEVLAGGPGHHIPGVS